MANKQPEPVILDRSHYDALVHALERLKQLPNVMDRAERCGVDCSEYRKMQAIAEEGLNKIRAEFFPKGPPK